MLAVTAYVAATLALLWAVDFLGGEGANAPWLVALKSIVAICAFLIFVRVTARRKSGNDEEADAPILVAFASQTGVAEELARRTMAALAEGGRRARLADLEKLDMAMLAGCETALFIASTTGEGDAPDNAAGFEMREMRQSASLQELRYAVLALGDKSYNDYCGFGRRLAAWLAASGATPIFERIDVDRGDEDAIGVWFERIALIGASTSKAATFQKWRLVERRQLNPGSDNPPLFHIGLAPPDPAPLWRAGDIAIVSPRNNPADVVHLLTSLALDPSVEVLCCGETMPLRDALDRMALPGKADATKKKLSAQALIDTLKPLPVREYSLASLPSDGVAELVVRQMKHPDGILGVGSGWLTAHAADNGAIHMRLRQNRTFHGPEDDRPMILIGAGSGVAGLRAHLKERRASGRRQNWLVFGERSREKDFLYRDEIERWADEGHLCRLDLGFLGDDGEQVLVQDILRDASDDIRQWIKGGACIYVCGSRAGLGEGVDRTLREMLGDDCVNALIGDGAYRRDVY